MKKLIAILLSFCLIAGTTAGCKKDASTKETKENPSAAENAGATETPATTPEVVDDGLESVWIITERNVNGRLFKVSYDDNYMVTGENYEDSSNSSNNRSYAFTSTADGLITEVNGKSANYAITYNEDGWMTSAKIFDGEGPVKNENYYTYNEQGQLTQSLSYYLNATTNKKSVDYRIVNEYNEDGLLIYRYRYRSEDDSRLEIKFTYHYNDAGQCIQCEEYNVSDKYTFTYTYEYDENGVLKKKTATNDYDSSWDYECTWNVTTNEQGLTTSVYASLHSSYRDYVYEEIRVEPQQAEAIRKNQELFLSQDILQTLNREIEMPLDQ